jgi:murein L,D-transpeptidase YafK
MKLVCFIYAFILNFSFNNALAVDLDVTHVVLLKGERKLQLLHKDKVIKEYKVALGFEPEGAKKQEGDGKTPEGKYTLDYRNPQSRYHKSIHISYPNKQDKEEARKRGLNPGGDVLSTDWVRGLAFWQKCMF